MKEVNPTLPHGYRRSSPNCSQNNPRIATERSRRSRRPRRRLRVVGEPRDVESFTLGRTDARASCRFRSGSMGATIRSNAEHAARSPTRSEVAIARVLGGHGIGKSAFIDLALGSLAERHDSRRAYVPRQINSQRASNCCASWRRRSFDNCCRARRATSMHSSRRLKRLTNDNPGPLAALVPELASIVDVDGADDSTLYGRARRTSAARVLRAFSPIPVALAIEQADRLDPDTIAELLSVALHGRHCSCC